MLALFPAEFPYIAALTVLTELVMYESCTVEEVQVFEAEYRPRMRRCILLVSSKILN
jgi:hypothetical protein